MPTALRADYQAELGPRMLRQLRVGIAVVVVLQSAFIPIDWIAQPEAFWNLLLVRLAWDVVMIAVVISARERWARASTLVGCIVSGVGLVAVINVAGGPSTGYAPGLVLLLLGMPVLLPLTGGQAASIVGITLTSFLIAPALIRSQWTWPEYAVYACFPVAAGIECIAACRMLDRLRLMDFARRREIQEARDQLEELDRAKTRFTANVHHELRTPLTLVLAPLEAIRQGDYGQVPGSIERTLATMHANGLRLLRLINNLLDLARLESGQLGVTRTPLLVSEVAQEAVTGANDLAVKRGVALQLRVDSNESEINADRGALEKVLSNLVGNALKFTEEGSVQVVTGPRSDGRTGVEIDVSDTGPGIPVDQLSSIFDRFAQVDSSSTRRHEGTGIGLSLVRELVELHSGEVWAESRGLGQGTTFRVVLPVGEADMEAPEDVLIANVSPGSARVLAVGASRSLATIGSESSTEIRSPSDFQGHRAHPDGTPEVIIAEDNPDMRELLVHLIGREFVVRAFENGLHALAAVRERAPDLVLTDVMMPEMSGTELCRALKEDPSTKGVPVMLVTSKAEREMQIEGLELGADDYVTKPFHPRELLARVRSLVRFHRLQSEVSGQNERLEATNRELGAALAELKEAEVQLVQAERLAAVGELSAGVAHEVNNPLNFARNSLQTLRTYVEDIKGIAHQVANLQLDDPVALARQVRELESKRNVIQFEDLAADLGELVDIVTHGLDRTAKLVTDLRDFAAPGGRERLPVDIAAGLVSTLQLVGQRIRDIGAHVELNVPEDLPCPHGDRGALNQVFLNLLKNASEALEGRDGGRIVVSADREGMDVVVRVQDDGPGMEANTRARLFEPFFTTKEAGRGTGLGLSMCRQIVREHGGTIEAMSLPGEGTEMIVRLPAE